MVIVTDSSFTERLMQVRERIFCSMCMRSPRRQERPPSLPSPRCSSPEAILEAYAAKQRDFGENYVQEMERKASAVAGLADAAFHLIGHLQSNKTKKAAELFSSIDSVDSVKLVTSQCRSETTTNVMIGN